MLRAIHRTFLNYFPPPRYLEMPAVGLDISDEVIRFAELKRVPRGLTVGSFGEVKIPPGVVEEGYIKEKEQLIKILSNLQKEHNLKYINASLPEEKAYLFKTTVPLIDEVDVKSAVQFKIEENVPVALSEAVYDVRLIKKPLPGETLMHVSVTVIHMKVVASYLEVFRAAGLIPLEFQIESHAITKALVPFNDTDTYIVVGLRETKTVLAIISGGEVQFTSTLHVGAAAVMQSLLEMAREKDTKKTEEKQVSGNIVTFQTLVNATSMLRDEIQKLLAYWDTHGMENGNDREVEHILISGSNVGGLSEYLSHTLDVPVGIGNPWVNILPVDKQIPPLTQTESLDYVATLGLAIPYD